MKRVIVVVMLALAVMLAACSSADTPETTAPEPTTDTAAPAAPEEPVAETPEQAPVAQASDMLGKIMSRGELVCGVNNTLPGFGNIDESGNATGFDVDFCRALAAALFGNGDQVQFRPLTAQERFTAVQTGEVDVLIRNTTHTATRDGAVGLDFGPTTFYDGQGMMVRKDLGVSSLDDLNGATICVQTGTTTELNLADNFRARGLDFTPVVFQENDQLVAAYDAGQCDGFTTDKSGLVSSKEKLTVPADHQILDVTMSKEPLGPSVLQGDAQWADIVNWVTWGLIQAEEFGITQANVDDMMATEDPNIKRFLGLEGELGMENFGIPNDFMVQVIKSVGNYGEIYDRNLGPDTPFDLPRGLNNLFTEGGLLYSPPFR